MVLHRLVQMLQNVWSDVSDVRQMTSTGVLIYS